MEWNVNNAFKSLKEMDPKSVTDLGIIPQIDPVDITLGTYEKCNSPSLLKLRKKSMTSVYLKYFETAPDGKTRRCKFCGQTYSIATATGNLGRHLSNRHPGYDKPGDALTTTAPPPAATNVAKKHQSEPKTPKPELDHLNWLLTKWLILSPLPPAMVEEKWLVNSFKYLNPSIQIWTSEKLQSILPEIFGSMQSEVKATVDKVSSKVSIALEFWTSYQQIYYMSVMCQWIDENWTVQKVLLDICRVPYPCGGPEIYHVLAKVLKTYNIEKRVISCTHDNSQSAIHACHALKEDMDGHKMGPFCYIPCAAHTLNMIIEDGLQTTKPIISKVREFAIEMNASSAMSEDFTQWTVAYQEGSWKSPLDVSVRWSGHYQMLDLVRKASKSMDAVIRKYDNIFGSQMLLSSAERNAMNIIHSYLEPFYKAIHDICTNKMPTLGLVLFFMDHISDTISNCNDSRHYPDWLTSASEEMAKKTRNYNTQVCNIFTYMTSILDPRIKVELIPENLNLKNYLDEARTHFVRNYSTGHFPQINNIYSVQETDNRENVSFAEEIARKKRRGITSVATDELTQYLSDPPALIPTNVLEWWKVNSARYPRLSVMARDFLSVQVTSVEPEELFSRKGDEIENRRFGLPSESTRTVLCVKAWLESGIKMKYKCKEIDYERLMELVGESGLELSSEGSQKKPK